MIELIAIGFFIAALLVPLAIITLTIQQSGTAILSALRGETIAPRAEMKTPRIRASQGRSTRLGSRPLRSVRAAA